MLNIIKGALGLVIPKEWSVVLEEMHIIVHFLYEIAHKTVEKVFLPCKLWSSRRLVGVGRSRIAAIFKGSIWMPSLDTTKPSRRPVSMQKTHLCGLSHIL